MRFLIVGCGISGVSFSWELKKRNIDFSIIDPCRNDSASFMSGGLINPVTGRKYNLQWNIRHLLKTAGTFYSEVGNFVQLDVMKQVEILKIHKSKAGADEWDVEKKNKKELSEFVNEETDFSNFKEYLFCHDGGLLIKQALLVDTKNLIPVYQQKLFTEGVLLKEEFQPALLHISENEISYKNEHYTHFVFCDGIQALQNKFFHWIPFKPAKGECFITECPELPQTHIYHKGVILVPIKKNIFWAGATNTWDDLTQSLTEKGKTELADQLGQLLKIPYNILEHKVAIRPTIKDRTPVVGMHPLYKNMFILNGMGTKGMMLAPYYAGILLQHILTNANIPTEANVLRFAQHLK